MILSTRVAVVGGGVIGSSIAWLAAESGFDVRLVDPRPASGASWVAGGMLAPVTEAWPGEEPLLELGSASLARWPAFAERLRTAAGADPGLRTEGTVVAAVDSADRDDLDRLADYLGRLDREVRRLTPRELRELEPAVSPSIRGGLSVPGDLAVDNRMLLAALRCACDAAGVSQVVAEARSVRPGAVELTDGSTVHGDLAVVAAGAWSSALHPALEHQIRPVKGEVLRLRARPSALPPPTRTLRGLVEGRPIYLVPRDGGGLVLGATQYEAGFDADVTVGGVRDLLRDAERVLPGVAEYALVECVAGFRPGSMDNLPLVGELEPGVLAATGHHRNGMLLAPITSESVLALLRGEELPTEAAVAEPGRLVRSVHSGGI
jgi:glycine oxidase